MTVGYKEYIRLLDKKEVSADMITEAKRIFYTCDDLTGTLTSLAVTDEEKHNIIEKLFPKKLHPFMKSVCDGGDINRLTDIM